MSNRSKCTDPPNPLPQPAPRPAEVTFSITHKSAQAVVDYLQKQPYFEVATLIQLMTGLQPVTLEKRQEPKEVAG